MLPETLERLRDLGIPAIAIAPHERSVLLAKRIFEAAPMGLYLRHEVATPSALLAVIADPDPARRPAKPSEFALRALGADRARANDAIHAYERSSLHGSRCRMPSTATRPIG